ncbi:MAG: formylglycine-generating enzyme family protein, partial [Chloroflexi bacterium]|nr:formylglycine-generating enzyme family protein [Chloroflexota bacterium]
EQPQHALYLPEYYIGRAPVTVAEFRAFVEATGYQPTDGDALKGGGDHPVRWVTWYDALAYARWRGMTLPSEAEWEKAARGTDGRIYPWGDEWLPDHANTEEYWKEGGRGFWRRLRARQINPGPTPVGTFSPQGDSPYGCVDMSGNVWEWTRSLWGEDWIKPDYGYPYDPADGREDLDAPPSVHRVLRGGSFVNNLRGARAAVRLRNAPLNRNWNRGIRVVVVPVSAASEP